MGQHTQKGALAAPVGADKRGKGSGTDHSPKFVQNGNGTVACKESEKTQHYLKRSPAARKNPAEKRASDHCRDDTDGKLAQTLRKAVGDRRQTGPAQKGEQQ